MKDILPLSVITILLVSGCSQKNGANTSGDSTNPASTAGIESTPQTANPAASAALNSLPTVTKAIEGHQYENAVQTLVDMKPATTQMTVSQRLQYQQAVRDATTALIGVKDRDPAARAAYEKLSRMATGR